MTAQHAVHRDDWDPACPDCRPDPLTVDDDEPATRCGTCGAPSPEWRTHACPRPSSRAGWVLLALVILAALAVALWRLVR